MDLSLLTCLTVLAVCVGVASAERWEPKLPDPLLPHLRAEHPRLLLTPGRVAEMKRLVREDATARVMHAQIMQAARKKLTDPLPEHKIADGKRLLPVSRAVLDSVRHLGYAWHMTGEAAYKERVWEVAQAAADFPDWNPSHFLDTAEMGLALALAYDWLYDAWTPQQRATLLAALDRHLLRHAEAAYSATGEQRGKWWWAYSRSNWNLVCNGGIIAAAVCLADQDPGRAARIVQGSFTSVQKGITAFGPDGGYPEGPMYWGYAVKYLVNYLGVLTTAFGGDFGLGDYPGLAATTAYPLHMTGPSGDLFAINDAARGPLRGVAEHLWLANRYNVPRAAAFRLNEAADDARPQDMLFYAPALLRDAEAGATLPATRHLADVGLFLHRTRWNDPAALFLGVTAGKDEHGHTQLDAGSFMLEADGVRFVDDVGLENAVYLTHNHEKVARFAFYRLRAEGHNTLVLDPGADGEDGGDQHTKAPARTTATTDGPTPGVTLDMAGRYPGKVTAYTRQFIVDGDRVQVIDLLTPTRDMAGWWFAHTEADVHVAAGGREATFERQGRRLAATLDGPAAAAFTVMPAEPLPGSPNPNWQTPNDGWRKLAVRFEARAGQELVLRVEFAPAGVK
ncbi:MAG: heparinase II/III family protein [Phycisphaerae bacterium]